MATYSNLPCVIHPSVFTAELDDNKFYICITNNVNETLARWRSGQGPIFVRKHRFRKIIEIEGYGNEHILQTMTVKYMIDKGYKNVRSSIKGHLANTDEIPKFYTEFKQRFNIVDTKIKP